MRISKTKLAVGTAFAGLTATGWGLYGAKANEPTETTLTKEETQPQPIIVSPAPTPVTLTLGDDLNQLIKDSRRFSWEISTRDAMIDHRNGQIEEFKNKQQVDQNQINALVNTNVKLLNENINLKKYIEEYEKYADDAEDYISELEKKLTPS